MEPLPEPKALAAFRQTFSVESLRRKMVVSPSPQPSIKTRNSKTLLPRTLESAIDSALESAWSPASKGIHRTALKKYLAFCEANNIPTQNRLPASEVLLCAFIATCTNRAPATLNNYVSGLRAYHIKHNLQWFGSTRLKYVREGMANSSPSQACIKAPRPPVTRAMLQTLHVNLNSSIPEEACILACADVAFWGQARLGELLLQAADPMPRRLPVPSFTEVKATSEDTLTVTLPYTKVKKWSGENITLTHQHDLSNPVKALRNHMAINSMPKSMPLFSFTSAPGLAPIVLTKRTFLAKCNEIWNNANLPRYTGHSFRIGGTTALLLAGVHPDLVKQMGRWSSDSYLRYWRDFHLLIPLNASYLPQQASSSSHGG